MALAKPADEQTLSTIHPGGIMRKHNPTLHASFRALALTLALCLAPTLAIAADLTVSAAASLTDAFKVVKDALKRPTPASR